MNLCEYRCTKCGASGVKLWRPIHVTVSDDVPWPDTLLCRKCGGKTDETQVAATAHGDAKLWPCANEWSVLPFEEKP